MTDVLKAIKETEYECPFHGNVKNSYLELSLTGNGDQDFTRKYCFLCYDEMLQKNVSQVTEVKEGD